MGYVVDIIALEHPKTEKYYAPKTQDTQPFFITEYGRTRIGIPCYQLRLQSPVSCVQYVVSGSGVIVTDTDVYPVQTGDTFLLPEGDTQIYYSNVDNRFERIWLNFKGTLATDLLQTYGIANVRVFRQTDTKDLLLDLQNCCKNNTDPQAYKDETAVLFLKLVQFLAKHKQEEPTKDEQTDEIRIYIDRHVDEKLSLEDIAEHFYLSQEHVIRKFKKAYDITPHQYMLQSKIRLAMVMLQSSELSVEEISEKLTFSDPRHFSATFKKFVGLRPSAYRNQFKKS